MPVREFPRLDLHIEAQTPSGRYYRWGLDEPKPENVPSGIGKSDTAPGGFDSITATLPRKPGVDYSDLERLTTLTLRGAGGEVCCEARLKEAPRTSGDQMSVTAVTEGWLAHLQDDATAAEVYRDVDQSQWQGPSRAQQIYLEGLNLPATGTQEALTDVTNGLPALRLHVDGQWESPVIPVAEAWFDAGPVAKVAKVYYDFSGNGNTSFVLEWASAADDLEADQVSGDIYTSATGKGTAEPTARRFFYWNWRFNTTGAGIEGNVFAVDLRRLAVYGNHGLTKRGTEPEAGFYASDIIANAVSRWAPLLNFTSGPTGTLRPTTNVIPHAVFKDPTTALAILQAMNAFEDKLYAVWEDKTFHYYNWGEVGRKWRARIAPTELSETGPSTERLRNGVIVAYRVGDGSIRSAGPIGSGCDIESSSLEDKDPENPANQRGIRMWGQAIDLGIVSVESEVIRVGALILARLKETDRSGQAKIVGICEDDKGVIRPASQVRAGDTITFIDAADTSERRIIRDDYDDASKTNSITLDAPPDGVPDLLAQLGVGIADLGL